jgi:hypothetical protein
MKIGMRTILQTVDALRREVATIGARIESRLSEIQTLLAAILQAVTAKPQPAEQIVITLGTPVPQPPTKAKE